MLESWCQTLDAKITVELAIKDKKLDRIAFKEFVKYQQQIIDLQNKPNSCENKIELIHDAIHKYLVTSPKNEEEIKSTYQPI